MFKPTAENQPFARPMFVVRGLPMAATLLLLVSVFAGTHQQVRSFCDGAALGLLIGYCVFIVASVQGVVLKDTQQPSDVQDLRIS